MTTPLLPEECASSHSRFPRLHRLDLSICLHFHDISREPLWERIFAIASRLGDGIFWYALMILMLLVHGTSALPAVLHMIGCGITCVVLYRWLKLKTTRPRPCHTSQHIHLTVQPLDQYSFPSGHTLHAVAFTITALAYYPQLYWLLVPFSILVAMSRMVTGLHYPSDVLAGALLGIGISALSFQLIG